MRLAAACLAALALAAPALASDRHPTLNELESEVMCPTCHTTLDQSDSPIARRIKAFIAVRIAAGDTKGAIESKLVAQFGRSIIAKPSTHGFDLLAWVLPFAGILAGAVALAFAARRWRERPPPPEPRFEPELERRLDEELARFEA